MNNTATALRRGLLLAACAVAFAAPAHQALAFGFGDWGEHVQGNGHASTQTREVGHFDGLTMALPGTVELRMGNTEGVTVEADDNLLPLVETVVEDGTLKIRPSKRNLNLRPHTLKIVVQARAIDHVALAGSGTINAEQLRAPKLNVKIGGSGTINVKDLNSETLAVSVGGSGELKTGGGAAREVSVKIAGSGNVDLGRVKSDTVSVKVAGSGDTAVWANKALAVTIAGSGDVSYYGDATVSKSVMGSGEVKHMGGAPR